MFCVVVGNGANPFLGSTLQGQGEVHVRLLFRPLVGDFEGVDPGDHVSRSDGVFVLHTEKCRKLVLLNFEVELSILSGVEDDVLSGEVVRRRGNDGRCVGVDRHDVAMSEVLQQRERNRSLS